MTRILIVDDQDAVRSGIRSSLLEHRFDIQEASTGAEALQKVGEQPGPWIVFLDRIIPEPDGFAVCRMLRDRYAASPPYVVMMSAKANREDIAHGIRAGADEFLLKPIPPDVVRNRVRIGLRRVVGAGSASHAILEGLREGARARSGELIVRDEDRVWRVVFHDGKLVWVAVSDDSESLSHEFIECGVVLDDLQAATTEARQSGRGVYEVLLEWQLLSADQLRGITQAWIQRRLLALLGCRHPRSLFVPIRYRGDAQGISFALNEVLPSEVEPEDERHSTIAPPGANSLFGSAFLQSPSLRSVVRLRLEQMMQIDGATFAAMLDRETGACEGSLGTPPSSGLVWANLQVLFAVGTCGSPIGDLVLSTADAVHVARVMDADSQYVVYVVVDGSLGSVGLARSALAQLAKRRFQ